MLFSIFRHQTGTWQKCPPAPKCWAPKFTILRLCLLPPVLFASNKSLSIFFLFHNTSLKNIADTNSVSLAYNFLTKCKMKVKVLSYDLYIFSGTRCIFQPRLYLLTPLISLWSEFNIRLNIFEWHVNKYSDDFLTW